MEISYHRCPVKILNRFKKLRLAWIQRTLRQSKEQQRQKMRILEASNQTLTWLSRQSTCYHLASNKMRRSNMNKTTISARSAPSRIKLRKVTTDLARKSTACRSKFFRLSKRKEDRKMSKSPLRPIIYLPCIRRKTRLSPCRLFSALAVVWAFTTSGARATC